MDVSIIIPFFNAEATLSDCLHSLQQLEGPSVEVILVDNRSTDRSPAIAADFIARARTHGQFRMIRESRPGASAARNAGARVARGRWLAFTDADCLVRPRWLVAALADSDGDGAIGAVAGPLLGNDRKTAVGLLHDLFTLSGLDADETHWRFTLSGGGFATANLMVRRSVFESISGFDETLPVVGEDHDLCARIYNAGYGIRFSTAAAIVHQHRSSVSATVSQSYAWGFGQAMLLNRYFAEGWLLEVGPWQWRASNRRLPVWISLRSADKKIAMLVVLAMVYWPLAVCFVAYCGYLVADMRRRLRSGKRPSGWAMAMAVSLLLVFKSTAMTAGRLRGSLRHRVVCI